MIHLQVCEYLHQSALQQAVLDWRQFRNVICKAALKQKVAEERHFQSSVALVDYID